MLHQLKRVVYDLCVFLKVFNILGAKFSSYYAIGCQVCLSCSLTRHYFPEIAGIKCCLWSSNQLLWFCQGRYYYRDPSIGGVNFRNYVVHQNKIMNVTSFKQCSSSGCLIWVSFVVSECFNHRYLVAFLSIIFQAFILSGCHL